MTMPGMPLEEIRSRLQAGIPGCQVEIVVNASPCAQHSLLIDSEHALEAARLLHYRLGLDYCSNMTAVDWPDRAITETVKTSQAVEGVVKEVVTTVKTTQPGYLEAVYHLYSVTRKEGPLVIRVRTGNRTDQVTLPSLTPVWRSAEFQEREAFDLFGIVFAGHPDLRRILMWDDFADHPMRKDYVPEPDDDFATLGQP